MTFPFRVPGCRLPVLKGLGAVAGSLAVALATACAGPHDSADAVNADATNLAAPGPAGPLEKTHLTVGAVPVSDDAPLYLAIKDGLFREAGLTVTAVPVGSSDDGLPKLLHGTVDVLAGVNYVSLFQAEATGGASLRILADAAHCQPTTFEVLSLPGSGISSPSGLAGKRVAVNATGSAQTLTLNSELTAHGASPSSVRYARIPYPDMISALKSHKVDAISTTEPYISGAEEQYGAVPVVSQCTGPDADFPLSGYFATRDWARKYPNTAKAFTHAIEEAQVVAGSDQRAVRSVLSAYTNVSAPMADMISMPVYPQTVSPTALEHVAIMMQSQGLLSKPLSVPSLLAG